jgi:carboxymethylenebutenolidase
MGHMQELTYNGQTFPVYLAEPDGEVKGGIIVIHEVWALTDHTKSVADRFAAEGYLVIAPDLLGTETEISKYAAEIQLDLFNPEKRNEAQPKLRKLMAPMQAPGFADKTKGKVAVCFEYLYAKPAVDKKVAVNGFCFGGSYSFSLATAEPRLKAAIPFYGHASTDIDELKKITCPILAFYGEKDENLMSSLSELKELMKEAGVDFTAIVYPDSGHAFFNDTNSFAYNEKAAKDAWQRTLEFLNQSLLL